MPENKKVNRTSQFMPFASLRGFYDLIAQQDQEEQEFQELLLEEIEANSMVLSQIQSGDVVQVVYHDKKTYQVLCGRVDKIRLEERFFIVDGEKIAFERLKSIQFQP